METNALGRIMRVGHWKRLNSNTVLAHRGDWGAFMDREW